MPSCKPIRAKPGLCICCYCGAKWAVDRPADISALPECTRDPQQTRAVALAQAYPCCHRGPELRSVQISCCGGQRALRPAYACQAAPYQGRTGEQRYRPCILDGTIANPEERDLVRVCARCPDRQQPA